MKTLRSVLGEYINTDMARVHCDHPEWLYDEELGEQTVELEGLKKTIVNALEAWREHEGMYPKDLQYYHDSAVVTHFTPVPIEFMWWKLADKIKVYDREELLPEKDGMILWDDEDIHDEYIRHKIAEESLKGNVMIWCQANDSYWDHEAIVFFDPDDLKDELTDKSLEQRRKDGKKGADAKIPLISRNGMIIDPDKNKGTLRGWFEIYMKANDLNPEKLASKTGVGKGNLYQVFTGDRKLENMSAGNLKKIADALNVSMDQIPLEEV